MLGAILCLRDSPEPSETADSVAAALQPHCDRILTFASAAGDDAPARRVLDADAGELPALTEVLREAGDDHAVVMADDLRSPSSALVRYMIQVRGSFEIVIPRYRDGTLQPLLALYHPNLLRRAEGLVAAGDRDLTALVELASVRPVTPVEIEKFGDPDALLERGGHISM